MTSLNLYSKAIKIPGIQNRPAQLYRRIVREIPKVLMIYDFVNIGEQESREAIKSLFYERAFVKDKHVIRHLLNTGYYDLEETLLQHKQKHHLSSILTTRVEKPSLSKELNADSTEAEHQARWLTS